MFQFPLNPVVGQTFNPIPGVTYRWNGTAWFLIAGPGAFISQAEADLRYLELSELPNIQNRIINGKVAIDQRFVGAPATAAAAAVYGPDRWRAVATGGPGQIVFRRLQDPIFTGEFVLLIGVGVADAVLGVGSGYAIQQFIEGVNTADFEFGTANASAITLAFEVQSNLLGTFPVAFQNSAADRAYVTTFTINAINTREQKIITIPGDTAGTWLKDNGIGLRVRFSLGDAAAGVTAPNVWTAGNFVNVAGSTNFMGNVANQIFYRNLRLYRGAVDFGVDRRLFAQELALCQRYYWKTFPQSVVPAQNAGLNGVLMGMAVIAGAGNVFLPVRFPVVMRAAPTVVTYNPAAANAEMRNFSANVDGTTTTSNLITDSSTYIHSVANPVSVASHAMGVHLTANAEL